MRLADQRRMPQGVGQGLGTASLAMLTGWFALWSWRPMIESPQHLLGVVLVCGLLIALVGALGRSARLPWSVVPLTQLVVLLLFLNAHYESVASWKRVVPTAASVSALVSSAVDGASAINTYAAPVSTQHPQIYPYLVLCATGILLLIDLLACGLGRVPLAGLPLLLTLSIPISILQGGLNPFVFVVTALLFLMLLATEEIRRVLGWGRAIGDQDRRIDSLDNVVNGSSVRAAALRIGALTTFGALVVPLLVPVGHNWFDHNGGNGSGGSGGSGITVVNPLVDLRRDLASSKHTPLLFAQTKDPDPTYIQLTVLDDFNGYEWKPSSRNLPDSNRADGPMPSAPGMASDAPGKDYTWNLRLASTFVTPWLPTPYPVRRIKVAGDWRYDSRTLDLVNTGDAQLSRGLSYSLTAFHPDFEAATLNAALSAPGSIQGPMTSLPSNLPSVIARTATRVTAGAPTDYQRAVALQNWFRNDGGFTYSLARAPGSGMSALAAFITTDKVGYCEQFAAAMAVMARALGIPARVVIGFRSPSSVSGRELTYTTDDLHAWPELYFSGRGWVPFEPTPSVQTGAAPAYTQGRLPTTLPSSATPTPTPTVSRAGAQKVDKQRPQQTQDASGGTPLWLPLGALVLLLLVLGVAPRAVRDARRRGRLDPSHDAERFADGIWAELRDTCRDLGIEWTGDRSPRATMRVLSGRIAPSRELITRLESLLFFIERTRYARSEEGTEAEREQVRETVVELSAELRGTASPLRARLAVLLPRSVFGRAERPAPAAPAPDRIDERV